MVQEFSYPSGSSKATHWVKVDGDKITCRCRGFNTPKKCWHVRDVAEKLGRELDISAFGARLGPPTGVEEKPVVTRAPASTSIVGSFIKPMLASALDESQSIQDFIGRPGWILEEKYNGHRRIVHVAEGGHVTLWARSGRRHDDDPRHIVNACRFLAPGTYDGELYLPGGQCTDTTAGVTEHRLKLALFDILKVGEVSAMSRTGAYRRELLEFAGRELEGDDVHIAPQFPVTAEGLDAIWARGGEGAIVKKTSVVYSPGRRIKEWVKFKKEGSAEAIITGFDKGSYGPQSVVVAVDRHGREVRVKSKNDKWRADFAKNPESFKGRTLVFSYQEKTRTGGYFHPMADHIL
jgi:hypothetical protein